MNILRKIIFFSFSVAVIFCFCTRAYATDYIDDKNIEYNTAVGVLSGIGIIGGYSDNSFRPNNTVTREEAAKMITSALLGPTAATNLNYSKSRFSDISEGRWSLEMIEWCAEKGIITGRGDGTFEPLGNISSYEFAKMLLCATGYGKNSEYTGTAWDYNASRDAFIKGIFNSSTGNITGKTTREQAAIYIFNTIMNIERVKYDGSYVPVDGTQAKDNTIAAFNFGLNANSIISGMIEGNSANGIVGTKIYNTGNNNNIFYNNNYNIKTGREMLGHYVTIYTNGKIGNEQIIYYLEDKSKIVTLTSSVSDLESYRNAFGYTYLPYNDIMVYKKDLTYSKSYLDNFSPNNGTAPAGTYILHGSEVSLICRNKHI